MKTLNKNEKIAIVISLIVVGFFFVFGEHLVSFFLKKPQENNLSINNKLPQIQDISVGQGSDLKIGDKVTLHYTGRLLTGDVFDSTVNSSPITFVLGQGSIIPWIELGLSGMKVGGKRIIVVPPELGYGDLSIGPIPANATVMFEVEVLSAE